MAYTLGIISQKGGVGKSTIARLLAREFVAAGWNAKIADLDTGQSTSYNWLTRRNRAGIKPYVPVQQYPDLKNALAERESLDVLIIDGMPHADQLTLKIARESDLLIIPTGVTDDDRDPGKGLGKELVRQGVPKDRIVFALCRVPAKASATLSLAYYDLVDHGFQVLEGGIPEQAAYAKASNEGRALTETTYSSLKTQAEQVAQSIVDLISNHNRQDDAEEMA